MNEQREERKKKLKKEYILLIIVVLVIILIDQLTKIFIVSKGNIDVIQGILKFSIVENKSGAYGIGTESTIMYILTNIVILSVVFKFITSQNEFIDKKLKILLSLILAGGISNVIDRIFRGYVVEFIDLKGIINLPIFNIADICILIRLGIYGINICNIYN